MANWNYRKRISIAPGIKLNLSKKGISTTLGVPGSSINIGKSEDGLKVLNVLSHIGYQYAQSSDYDAERAAQNMLKK